MKKRRVILIITLALASMAGAHCQIPCGIYGDHARIDMMEEHVEDLKMLIHQFEALYFGEPVADPH